MHFLFTIQTYKKILNKFISFLTTHIIYKTKRKLYSVYSRPDSIIVEKNRIPIQLKLKEIPSEI